VRWSAPTPEYGLERSKRRSGEYIPTISRTSRENLAFRGNHPDHT
jgi:hypothetical protein